MVIAQRNILYVDSVKSFLSANTTAGDTTIPLRNTSGFVNNYAIQIGETGIKTSEVLIGNVSNVGTLVSSTTNFDHPTDTPIYSIKYDQVVFERSTAGTAGTATPIATVTYQGDSPFTSYDDPSGTAGYAYKTYYRNSSLGLNSVESDWLTTSGPLFYSLAYLRQRIKDKLWSDSYLKDSMVDDWINEWKDEMTNSVIQVNQNYALGTESVAFGTSGYGTITTADFKQVRKFWVTFDGINSFRSTKANPSDFQPDQQFSSVHPYHGYHGDTVFQVFPSLAGTASIEFYRFGTVLSNDTDLLPQPFRPYTKSFVDYALAQAYLKDSKVDLYDRMLANANKAKEDFVLQIAPRDKTGPTLIRIVQPTTGDDWMSI